MSKYSDHFKLTAVRAYLEGSDGLRKIAQRFAMDVSLLRRWVATYQQHGRFSPHNKGQRHSPAFKQSVLEYMRKHQLSLRQTAAHFALGQSSQIGIWAQRHYSGKPALSVPQRRKPAAMTKRPKPLKPVTCDDTDKTREQLMAELEYMRMENAYLKELKKLREEERRRVDKP